MKNFVAGFLAIGAMLAGLASAPVHAQVSAAPAPAGAGNVQPTPAQKLIGNFAPKLVELTDNVLFGDVWARPELSPRDRSLVTVSALIAMEPSRPVPTASCESARNGVTQDELGEAITHLAFYVG